MNKRKEPSVSGYIPEPETSPVPQEQPKLPTISPAAARKLADRARRERLYLIPHVQGQGRARVVIGGTTYVVDPSGKIVRANSKGMKLVKAKAARRYGKRSVKGAAP